jgi:fatty acid synthase, animal type
MAKIPNNSLVIEVAPHSLFESIFKRCYPHLIYTGLMKRTESDNLNFIISSIGALYTLGLNPDIENLYPPIEWPVSRGTQSISSLIKWDHERVNKVKKFPAYHNYSTASDYRINFRLAEAEWAFLSGHSIEKKILFPASGYLMFAWRRLAALKGQPWKKTPVAFENVRY